MVDWVDACADMLQSEEALVIVSIASVQGSSPREAGARMLVTQSDVRLTIGGGNLEYQCIDIARKLLARISHHLPAAAADKLAVPGFVPFSRLYVVSTTPASSSSPRSPAQRHLDPLATKRDEKRGPGQNDHSHYQRFSLAAGLGQCCGGVVTVLFEKISAAANWIGSLHRLLTEEASVMQVIALDRASTLPRLLVSPQRVEPAWAQARFAPIIDQARHRLAQKATCGIQTLQVDDEGRQSLLFDPVRSNDFNLLLFGAGHVGSALVSMLAQQPCQVSWVDTRDDYPPAMTAPNIETVCTDTPLALVDAARPGSYFLVMTHDHRLDQQLAEQILKRDDFAWFGMIGSCSKRMRFEHRLRERGIENSALQKMVCPIGIGGIKSKLPSAIAVSVMAQLLRVHEKQVQPVSFQRGHEQTR